MHTRTSFLESKRADITKISKIQTDSQMSTQLSEKDISRSWVLCPFKENFFAEFIGGSLELPWWLIGGFCPEIFDRWWEPTKGLFAIQWMEMGWGLYLQVVGTPQHYMREPNCFTIFALRGVERRKISLKCMGTRPHAEAIGIISRRCYLMPRQSITSGREASRPRTRRATSWNFHCLIFLFFFFLCLQHGRL